MEIVLGPHDVSISELKAKGPILGRLMYEIACLEATTCRDKDAYMELLEATALNCIRIARGDHLEDDDA